MKIFKPIVIILIICVSCIKGNIDNIDITNIRLNPEFAFPIGEQTIKFEYYNIEHRFDTINTIDYPVDSILDSVFYFIGHYYPIPEDLVYNIPLAFSFSEYQDSSNLIQNFRIKTNMISGIPGDVSTQIYFLSNGDTIEQLYKPEPFQVYGASVSNGEIKTTELISKSSFFTSTEQIDNLLKTDTILISTRLKIPPADSISLNFTNDLSLWVQIAASITFNLEF